MKNTIIPTDREVRIGNDEMIVSKTDLQGRMTYVNRVFMRTANYPEWDVLGKQHNLVRHPDMPRGVFRMLWETLKKEQEFFGYVKNLSSDGGFYWVFANVTPDYDASGKVVGYFSVRKIPREGAVARISALYAEMLREEQRIGPAQAPEASIRWLNAKLQEMGSNYLDFVLQLQGEGKTR